MTSKDDARTEFVDGLPCAHKDRPCSPIVGDCLCQCPECADRRGDLDAAEAERVTWCDCGEQPRHTTRVHPDPADA